MTTKNEDKKEIFRLKKLVLKNEACQEYNEKYDPLIIEAAYWVTIEQQVSEDFLQNKLKIGKKRAGRIIRQLMDYSSIVTERNGALIAQWHENDYLECAILYRL